MKYEYRPITRITDLRPDERIVQMHEIVEVDSTGVELSALCYYAERTIYEPCLETTKFNEDLTNLNEVRAREIIAELRKRFGLRDITYDDISIDPIFDMHTEQRLVSR